MSDIVQRLRHPVNNWNSGGRFEAADEIEALRAALRHAIDRLSDLEYHWHSDDLWGPIKPYTDGGEKSVFAQLPAPPPA